MITTENIKAWLQLLRFPALFTAIGNVATGFFCVAHPPFAWDKLALLSASSSCLYTAGMVSNDYFDRVRDTTERPARPIPSGRIRAPHAWIGAIVLFLSGLIFAGFSGPFGLIWAIGVTVLVLLYNGWKRCSFLMALCRFSNVALGASSVEFQFPTPIFCLLVAVWTLGIMYFSRREVEKPQYQKIIKKMILGFIVLDAIFVTFLAGPIYGLAVLSLLVPSVLLARWIYVT